MLPFYSLYDIFLILWALSWILQAVLFWFCLFVVVVLVMLASYLSACIFLYLKHRTCMQLIISCAYDLVLNTSVQALKISVAFRYQSTVSSKRSRVYHCMSILGGGSDSTNGSTLEYCHAISEQNWCCQGKTSCYKQVQVSQTELR